MNETRPVDYRGILKVIMSTIGHKRLAKRLEEIISVPPTIPLVGVELNPGPPKSQLNKLKSKIDKLAVALVPVKKKQKKRVKGTKGTPRTFTPYAAPINIGTVVSLSPPSIRTVKRGNKHVKIVSGVQYVTTINSSTSSASPQFGNNGAYSALNTYIAIDVNGFGDTASNVLLTPNISPLYNEGLSYSRFLFKKLKFHYRTTCGTGTFGGFTLGYAADAFAYNNSNNTNNTRATLGLLQDNVTFSAWENATLDCTAISSFNNPFYDITTGSSSAANARQTAQGCLLISAATAITGTAAGTFGDLLMEYECEFYDCGPYSNSGVTFLQKQAKLLGLQLVPIEEKSEVVVAPDPGTTQLTVTPVRSSSWLPPIY